jgi:hypothetical protein
MACTKGGKRHLQVRNNFPKSGMFFIFLASAPYLQPCHAKKAKKII